MTDFSVFCFTFIQNQRVYIMAKREVGFFKAPFLVLFSKKLYRDICYNWKGIGFTYITLLSIVIATIFSFKASTVMNEFKNSQLDEVVAEIPSFRIKDGVFSSKVRQPYVMDWNFEPKEGDKPFPYKIVIDTTRKSTSLKGDELALINSESISVKKQNNVIQTMFFKDMAPKGTDYVVTKDMIRGLLLKIVEYSPTVIGIFAFIVISIVYFIKVIFYSIILSASSKSKLSFAQASRLSAYALTAGILLDSFTSLSFFLVLLVNIGYLVFAVKACKVEPEIKTSL